MRHRKHTVNDQRMTVSSNQYAAYDFVWVGNDVKCNIIGHPSVTLLQGPAGHHSSARELVKFRKIVARTAT